MYWYELLHRPIDLQTQPVGGEYDYNHINRKGKKFGKVSYNEKLTPDQLKEFELEPINHQGFMVVDGFTKERWQQLGIHIPFIVVEHWLKNNEITLYKRNGFDYIRTVELYWMEQNEFEKIKLLYDKLKGERK